MLRPPAHVASNKIRGVLLKTARLDFPAFYQHATVREAQTLDMLVLLTALFVRLNEPTAKKNRKLQWRDEECATTRQMFTELRAIISQCPTFLRLPLLEQQKIAQVIFDRVD